MQVSIPYKSGPKFCAARILAELSAAELVSIPYKSGPKFCVCKQAALVAAVCFFVSIPYKSGPKFCDVSSKDQMDSLMEVSIPYKSGPKFCVFDEELAAEEAAARFNPLQIGS